MPTGKYFLKEYSATQVDIMPVDQHTRVDYWQQRDVTTIKKNEAGDFYATKAELLTAVSDFFADASTGGGGGSTDALTLGGHLPAYFEASGVAQSLVTQLLCGADTAYNTLKKLQDLIVAQSAIIGGSTADGDSIVNTVAELLAVFSTFPEGSNMVTLLTAKLNTSDVYNALDSVIAGKALDSRQGKVLNDLISGLQIAVNGKATPADITAAIIANNVTNAAADVIADAAILAAANQQSIINALIF